MVGLYFQESGLCLLSLCVMSVGRMVLVHNSRESLTDQLSCSVRVKCCCYKGGWKSLIKFTEQFLTEMERSEYAASPGLSSPVSVTAPVSHTATASHVCVILRTHSVHVYQGGVIHGQTVTCCGHWQPPVSWLTVTSWLGQSHHHATILWWCGGPLSARRSASYVLPPPPYSCLLPPASCLL